MPILEKSKQIHRGRGSGGFLIKFEWKVIKIEKKIRQEIPVSSHFYLQFFNFVRDQRNSLPRSRPVYTNGSEDVSLFDLIQQ